MKLNLKLALCLFAFGLGSATAYADTPRGECETACYRAFDKCNGPFSDGPSQACIEAFTTCFDPCDQL